MSEPLTFERMTRDDMSHFVSTHYFSAKEDNPDFYQVYFHDHAFTYKVLEEGRIIGAFGLNVAWRGVGEVWLMSTDHLNAYPIWMIKTFRQLTESALDKGGLHRVQMFVDNNDKKLHRWARALGFEFEGVMRKHSADQTDHAVYSKIK